MLRCDGRPGDVALEMSFEDVPIAQKRIISVCRDEGVPVITATQMLESMITFHKPTRAEAADIANAILDGSDAVMLSAESAVGRFRRSGCDHGHHRREGRSGLDLRRVADSPSPFRITQTWRPPSLMPPMPLPIRSRPKRLSRPRRQEVLLDELLPIGQRCRSWRSVLPWKCAADCP